MLVRTFIGRSLAFVALVSLAACKKNPPEANHSNGNGPAPQAASDSGVTVAAADTGVAQAPAGPRAEVPGEHCALTAALTSPAAVPGPTTVEVQLDAKDGFHINELDEVQLQLEGSNATVRAELARTDATESTQDKIKFVVPVQVAAAGAGVRGRLRFSVCASVCVRQRLAFNVALAQ
ncbi:MAG: hypothetical protein JNK05_18620 [Myxococcales bacterium]|nr:hypothetical protein [Myxococcales bacterium]